MGQHVYARLTGFGWTLLPLAPYRFERATGSERTIMARHEYPTGPRTATLSFAIGPPEVYLGEGQPASARSSTCCPAPTMTTGGPPVTDQPSVLDLRGLEGPLIYVRVPLPSHRIPASSRVAATGQSIRRRISMVTIQAPALLETSVV
jgi:hypothetical protein